MNFLDFMFTPKNAKMRMPIQKYKQSTDCTVPTYRTLPFLEGLQIIKSTNQRDSIMRFSNSVFSSNSFTPALLEVIRCYSDLFQILAEIFEFEIDSPVYASPEILSFMKFAKLETEVIVKLYFQLDWFWKIAPQPFKGGDKGLKFCENAPKRLHVISSHGLPWTPQCMCHQFIHLGVGFEVKYVRKNSKSYCQNLVKLYL